MPPEAVLVDLRAAADAATAAAGISRERWPADLPTVDPVRGRGAPPLLASFVMENGPAGATRA